MEREGMQVERRAFELPLGEGWKIAVVADTHGDPHPRALDALRAHAPALIVHAGDIGRLGVLEALATVAPLVAVRGNIDGRVSGVPDVVELDLRRGGRPALPTFVTHIAVYGPRLRPEVRRRARVAGARLVLCGHSHVPFILRDGELTVFNPGSIGPRRGELPITFGVMGLAEGRLTLEHFDCETGARWLPPLAVRRR